MSVHHIERQHKYHLLDTMGISLWIAKQTNGSIQSTRPIFCAPCLVLLPYKPPYESTHEPLCGSLYSPSRNVEQDNLRHSFQKTLTGMLSVLELKPNELCIAWVPDWVVSSQYSDVINNLCDWAPSHVLMMGEILSKNLLGISDFQSVRSNVQKITPLEASVHVTYHPDELQKNPEYKKQAYHDLLKLKAQLKMVKL